MLLRIVCACCRVSHSFILWAGSLQALSHVLRCIGNAKMLCNTCLATGDKTKCVVIRSGMNEQHNYCSLRPDPSVSCKQPWPQARTHCEQGITLYANTENHWP